MGPLLGAALPGLVMGRCLARAEDLRTLMGEASGWPTGPIPATNC